MKLFKALSIFIGTIIGAGIFGLPYVVAKSGLILGFFYFLVLGGSVLLLHLFLGEALLRTAGQCRLPGLAQKYLGKPGKFFTMVSVVVGLVGALLAFLILGVEFLNILFSSLLDLSRAQFTLIFWLILSYFIFKGIKFIASIEVLTTLFFFAVMAIILFFSLPKFNSVNINFLNIDDAFLPFGVILFSLIGWSAVPAITDFLRLPQEREKIKKIMVLTMGIVALFYLFFVVTVIGVSGQGTSEDALSGLLPFLGQKIIILGALAGLITLADSFLILGLHLKNTFIYDLKLPPGLAVLISCGLPLLLFLLGLRSFIATLGFVGTVVGAIEGVVIILIFKRAKTMGDRKPEYNLKTPSWLPYLLIAIFVFGALSQFFI